MRSYRAIIVDDEPKGVAVLSKLIQLYTPTLEVVGTAGDIATAQFLIRSCQPEIVFLDIKMNRESGFDLLEEERQHLFSVIFVTGYEEYAIAAIRAGAVDYLLKPVSVDELKQAVSRAQAKIDRDNHNSSAVDATPNTNNDVDGVLAIHQHQQVILIQPDEVVYAISDRRYCKVHLQDDTVLTVAKSLSELEKLWADKLFCRVSRGVLVNIIHIKSYSKHGPGLITITSGKTFPISRRKKSEVIRILHGTT